MMNLIDEEFFLKSFIIFIKQSLDGVVRFKVKLKRLKGQVIIFACTFSLGNN